MPARSRRGRSEGSIYQRPDGLWVGSISLGVHGGKRIRRVAYGKSKAEASAKLRELQMSLDAGQLPDAASITLEAWLARWLELVEPSIEPATHQPYRIHVNKHIVPRIGGVKIQRLRPADVEALYAKLLKDGVRPASVRKIGITLSIALNHAARSQLIPANPARGVRRPKAKKPTIVVLSAENAAAFVRACAEERLGALFVLILDSGMRPGEALALAWRDIDFAAGRVSITKSLENSGRVKEPKTLHSKRTIDLTAGTLGALNRHRQRMLAEGWPVRPASSAFVNLDGEPILPNDITRGHLRPILARAKLPAVTCYALRHTCATLLLAANVNPKIVSERLGHGSIAITMDTYSHVQPGMQRGAVDVLAKVITGG
ncbi:MAG TPA: tyrosine-type recombinase/integrase [Urbifossiella sp.]|nr:tyrosine-type recombinase/integrase [Urbifossiella sp.]